MELLSFHVGVSKKRQSRRNKAHSSLSFSFYSLALSLLNEGLAE